MSIKWLRGWAPFKIDALGLVTLLGAEEVNRSVGRLSKSYVTEYLPVVASFVFANDSFRSGIPGMEMYNISDGIIATDLAGWFSRWLLMQNITYNCTTLSINVRTPYAQQNKTSVLAISLGLAASFSVIILACLTSDWWGLANALSLGISVLVRSAMLEALRRSVDRSASTAVLQSGTVVKIFCKLTTGSVVTIYAPRGVVTQCLLTDPRPSNWRHYFSSRSVSWLAFDSRCDPQHGLFAQPAFNGVYSGRFYDIRCRQGWQSGRCDWTEVNNQARGSSGTRYLHGCLLCSTAFEQRGGGSNGNVEINAAIEERNLVEKIQRLSGFRYL